MIGSAAVVRECVGFWLQYTVSFATFFFILSKSIIGGSSSSKYKHRATRMGVMCSALIAHHHAHHGEVDVSIHRPPNTRRWTLEPFRMAVSVDGGGYGQTAAD